DNGNQFDTIVADGDVSLQGTLELLVNPAIFNRGVADDPTYTPAVGDTFDIIQIASISPAGDYDGSGTVDEGDYDLWKAAFGSTEDPAADGNGDMVVDAADYTLWRDNLGAMGGTVGSITGTFAEVVVTDPT